MNPAVFFDTNVILYLLSANQKKADVAESLLANGGIVSIQVLNEATSVCRRKLSLPWFQVQEIVSAVKSACHVVPLTLQVHESAVDLARRHQLSFYDALICSAAQHAGAAVLYSEDMHDGQVLGSLTIRNPFL